MSFFLHLSALVVLTRVFRVCCVCTVLSAYCILFSGPTGTKATALVQLAALAESADWVADNLAHMAANTGPGT